MLSKGLHVGVFLGQNLPSYQAHSINVMKMAQGFKNMGCKVEVITADSENVTKFKLNMDNIYSHYGVDRDLKIKYLSPSPEAYKSGKTRNDPTFVQRAYKHAKRMKYDFVYCRNLIIPYYTAREGIPTFVESHDWKYDLPKLQQLYKIAHLKAFKGMVTIHKEIKKEHLKRGFPADKIFVMEDGTDLKNFDISNNQLKWRKELGFDSNKQYAVYCGNLYPDRGIDQILKAAERMQHMKNLVFLLVGGYERDRLHWEKYCEERKIRNVQFTGFVSNIHVPKYLKVADCLLLPYSLEDVRYRIASPLKLFDYMASRRPIVATDIPAVSRILKHQHDALLVKRDDISGFCNHIRRLLSDKELGAQLSKHAFRKVQKYTWDNRCKEVLKIYEQNPN